MPRRNFAAGDADSVRRFLRLAALSSLVVAPKRNHPLTQMPCFLAEPLSKRKNCLTFAALRQLSK